MAERSLPIFFVPTPYNIYLHIIKIIYIWPKKKTAVNPENCLKMVSNQSVITFKKKSFCLFEQKYISLQLEVELRKSEKQSLKKVAANCCGGESRK